MSTLTVPASVPSPAEDCEQLHKAIEGWGTNEDLIISILAHRNAQQRKLIRQTYAEIYGKNLFKELDKELSGDFDSALFLWALDPPERDAVLAHEAVKKWHPASLILIEIACTRSSKDLFLARQAYHESYKRSIEEDVAYYTKGSFRKLLVPLVSAYRYEGLEVNMTLAKTEAKKLHEKISEKAYDDEEVIRIVTTRSKAQLGATYNHYIDQFGNSVDQDLEETEKDDFVSALRSVICCLISPEKHFEEVLRLAISGVGTDEAALTRVVTTRAEVDMEVIKEQYYKRNSIPLEKAISSETSRHYEAMLLALIGYENA